MSSLIIFTLLIVLMLTGMVALRTEIWDFVYQSIRRLVHV